MFVDTTIMWSFGAYLKLLCSNRLMSWDWAEQYLNGSATGLPSKQRGEVEVEIDQGNEQGCDVLNVLEMN
jgi:hypothetical protein